MNYLWQKIVSFNAKLGDFIHGEAKIHGINTYLTVEKLLTLQGLYFPGIGSERRHKESFLCPIFIHKQNLPQAAMYLS